MSRFHWCVALSLVSSALLPACSGGSGSAEDGGPSDAAVQDATQVVSLEQVQPIFEDSCGGALCHIDYSGEPGGGLDLSAGVVCDELMEVRSKENPLYTRVFPGRSDASYLLCKLLDECEKRPEGSERMPLAAPVLPQEQIDTIAAWIDGRALGCELPDRQAPEFDGISAAEGLPQAIRLSWGPAADATTPPETILYLVYESSTPGIDFTQVSRILTGVTSTTFGPFPPNTTRYYAVRSQDEIGNYDRNTVEISATATPDPDTTPPTFAGAVSATALSSGVLEISWDPATDDGAPPEAISYRVYLSDTPGGQSFAGPIVSTGPGETRAAVISLSPSTEYYAVVRAVDWLNNAETNTVEIAGATTATTSFADRVQPILDAKCNGSVCHAPPSPKAGLDLSPGAAYDELVGSVSTQCTPDKDLVVPGDVDNSYLVNKLLGIDLCAGSRMPRGLTIEEADRASLIDWVRDGAPSP